MVIKCHLMTCTICVIVKFVISMSFTGVSHGPSGDRPRAKAFCRPKVSAHAPATGAVTDPDRRRARRFAELRQSDRAQPAAGHGPASAQARGNLRPRPARS